MGWALLFLAASIARGESLVTFRPAPGSTMLAGSEADRQMIREAVDDTLAGLVQLTGRRARPVTVRIFRTREEFMTVTQVPPDFGAITLDGVILVQPPEMLDRNRGLCRILAHEAVHHFFYRMGRRWPRSFHEALAHWLSGGEVAESPRAAELAARARSGAEEGELEAHLAWRLTRLVHPIGKREFLRRLLAGEVDLRAFR